MFCGCPRHSSSENSLLVTNAGLAYVIRPHGNPPGRVAIWLHVHSGSLNETDATRGIAHYLEHMAFNGSHNFPPGSLIPFFQALGMTFGRDQNAFTGFDQTTYTLTLPDARPETLDKGLLYLSDDIASTRQFVRGRRPDWEERFDAFATHVIDVVRSTDADEVIVVGHSSGSFVAANVLARALARDPSLGTHGPRVALLTLGANLLRAGEMSWGRDPDVSAVSAGADRDRARSRCTRSYSLAAMQPRSSRSPGRSEIGARLRP